MSITKKEQGWLADIRLGGRTGKRYRKTFKTKAEALRWEAWMQSQHTQNPGLGAAEARYAPVNGLST